METQAKTAGPEYSRLLPRPASLEAAGPASPRLVLKEIRLSIGVSTVEAEVSLQSGSLCFAGKATGNSDKQPAWQLAAAATVAAIQHYLQQCATAQPAPRLQLIDLATVTTEIGQEVVHATVSVANEQYHAHLLGSALVRNDWFSTAVAAALDATSRQIPRLAPTQARQATSPSQPQAALEDCDGEGLAGDAGCGYQPRPILAATASHVGRASSAAPAVGPALLVGIEIGPTSLRAAAIDGRGTVFTEARRPSRAFANPESTLEIALGAAREAITGLNIRGYRIGAIGVALPGRLRPREGLCVSWGDSPAWREVPLASPFEQEFHLPVALIGATQAAGLAEMRFGAARDLSSVVFVRVGIEIDAAVVRDGQQPLPEQASPGQAGHMVVAPGGPRCSCGELGCWEAVAGREALVARVVRDISSGAMSAISSAVGNRLGAVSPALICQLAAAGDKVARSALEETGRYLALGLGNLIALFDPEAVIIDSMPAPVGAALCHTTEIALKNSPRAHILSRCAPLSPSLGDAATVLGAAAWAAQQFS